MLMLYTSVPAALADSLEGATPLVYTPGVGVALQILLVFSGEHQFQNNSRNHNSRDNRDNTTWLSTILTTPTG